MANISRSHVYNSGIPRAWDFDVCRPAIVLIQKPICSSLSSRPNWGDLHEQQGFHWSNLYLGLGFAALQPLVKPRLLWGMGAKDAANPPLC
jgi:hypothetical protein